MYCGLRTFLFGVGYLYSIQQPHCLYQGVLSLSLCVLLLSGQMSPVCAVEWASIWEVGMPGNWATHSQRGGLDLWEISSLFFETWVVVTVSHCFWTGSLLTLLARRASVLFFLTPILPLLPAVLWKQNPPEAKFPKPHRRSAPSSSLRLRS